ncbi:M56 family metallopeptidase [Streptomyces sp. NPDC050428]|uniref:M56 family metallopeptidase n=1 Tax=Streptomyces sp. NPDC050428 TaxID=3155757 RepID=UPI00341781B5
MNHHLLPPLALALATGFLLPILLARGRWAHHAPRLAICVWALLGALFTAGLALSVLQTLLPYRTSHRLSHLTEECLPWSAERCRPPGPSVLSSLAVIDYVAVGATVATITLPCAAFLREIVRARRQRAGHAELLSLLGKRNQGLRATVLEHSTPAVYCLPGRAPQVIVSTGALSTLTECQLNAAVEHERAHIAGRHHLMTLAVQAFAAAFPRLPLAGGMRREVPLLLEMAADDRALRRCSRETLALALYAMAAGQAPAAALAMGGPSAVLRVRRLLTPRQVGHAVLQGLFATTAVIAGATPLILACCSIPG